jgi:hypothetical protein
MVTSVQCHFSSIIVFNCHQISLYSITVTLEKHDLPTPENVSVMVESQSILKHYLADLVMRSQDEKY